MQEFELHEAIQRILVVNRPLSLGEMVKKRIWRRNGQVRQVANKTYVIDTVLPDTWQPVIRRRDWIPQAYGHSRTLATVQHAIEELDFQEYNLWTNSPISVPLFNRLNPSVLAFDMTDNLLRHPDYRTMENLPGYYTYLRTKADVLSANSIDNTRWLQADRTDTIYIPNGVDPSKFNHLVSTATPSDILVLPRPIVGYAGKMQEMFDVQLMHHIVDEFPDVTFVFIGQQLDRAWMKHLWKHSNVHYLGDKHYEKLPAYLAAFDICIIPYNVDRQHGGDPIKVYEYLAAGKPVVTTDIGGVSTFGSYPQVRVASSHSEFAAGLREFIEVIQNGKKASTRDLPVETYWSTKTDRIIQAILCSSHESANICQC